ncbi:hypothetical protein [Lutibacter sp.]
MKNLKKLTVVLFATLLSFNFTSCIDDGVSDAVDQVYLAQAQFLLAQSALKDAEAAYQNARAASELANAAYTDALTANQQAVTAQFIASAALQNQATEAQLAFQAAMDAFTLAEAQALNEVTMQLLATQLAQAQSAHDVAMVELAEAVQDAKDVILTGLYGNLVMANNTLDGLMADKLNLQADLALKELLLSAPGNTITWAYAQAALEGTLAGYVADLAAAEANLAATQAATPSAGQQQLTDLETQIAGLEADADALEVPLAEAQNAEDAALAQWNVDNAKFADIDTKMAEIAFVEAEIQAHLDEIEVLDGYITDTRDIIDVQIPDADAAILTAEADADAVIAAAQADVTAAQDDVTAAQADLTAAQADLDAKVLVETAAQGDLTAANAALTTIQTDIAALTLTYNNAVNALAAHLATESGLLSTQAAAVAALATADGVELAAQAAYDAAVLAFDADPTGSTVTNPGPDGIAGDPNDGLTTYVYITALGAAPTLLTPTTANTTATGAIDPADSGVAAPIAGALLGSLSDVENRTLLEAPSDAVGDHYDAEADDVVDTNANILVLATNALDAAIIAVDAAQVVVDTADTAIATYASTLADLQADYLYQQGLFDDAAAEEALVQAVVDAAQAAFNTAAADVIAATTVRDNANTALTTANTALTTANTALTTAIADKVTAVATAQATRDALGVVADLEDDILGWMDDIADINALMPTHNLGLAYLQAELADLMAAFGLDPTLFDTEYFFGYVPSYGAWLDAMKATAAVQAEIDAIDDQIAALENIWDAVTWFVSSENVDDFLAWQAAEITSYENQIASLELAIEQQEVLIAKGELEADSMAAAIAECVRQIAAIDEEIAIQEGIITDLMTRINTYIN